RASNETGHAVAKPNAGQDLTFSTAASYTWRSACVYTADVPYAGDRRSRSALCTPYPQTDPRIYRRCSFVAGPRHWRKYRDLQSDRCGPAEAPARPEPL